MESNMIKLYQLSGYWGIPSPSPFCMKLETYLRMANIEYESYSILDPLAAPQNRMAPKSKIPFVEIDKQLIGDSDFIIELLKKKFGDAIDNELSRSEKAMGLTIKRMFEDHYFWAMVYSRWFDEAVWAVTSKDFFGGLSWPLQKIIPILRKKRMGKVLYHQGIGRNTQKEIYDPAKKDLDAFVEILADKAFVFGDQPTTIDAVAHGFLVNTMHVPFEYELKHHSLQYDSLRSYCDRMNKLFYPDQASEVFNG
jgi:glutathione S-transferase